VKSAGSRIQFQDGDVARAAWFVGAFATLWAAMQFIFSPIIGAASDRFGRRKVNLLSAVVLRVTRVIGARVLPHRPASGYAGSGPSGP
jgi:MFS transporter, DHA1 family, tetracycline resistance protein